MWCVRWVERGELSKAMINEGFIFYSFIPQSWDMCQYYFIPIFCQLVEFVMRVCINLV